MGLQKHFSIISIVLAAIFLALKLQLDITVYQGFSEPMAFQGEEIAPSSFAGAIKIALGYTIAMLVSLLLSILGYKRLNKYRKVALILNISTILYQLLPIGLLFSKV